MNYKQYILDSTPSPFDSRDYNLDSLGIPMAQNFPNEFLLDLTDLKIMNQGYVGCCCAEATAYTKFIDEHKLSGNKKPFSKGWIYGNRNDDEYLGIGLNPKVSLSHLLKDGVPYEEDFFELVEMPQMRNDVLKVKDSLLSKANNHKIVAYCRVTTDPEIKTALMNLGAVLTMIPVYESYYQVNSDGIVKIPDTKKEKFYGYHEVTIVGWRNDNKWILLNSWGEKWGDHGKFYLDYNFPIVESWSVTNNISIKPTPPKPVDLIKQANMCLQYDMNIDYNARLKITGDIDSDTIASLNGIKRLLVEGHRSHVVQWIQQKLIGWEYLKEGQDTMILDEPTFNAIVKLQENWDRPNKDGVMRIETWNIFLNN